MGKKLIRIKISIVIFSILGIVIAIDGFLQIVYNIGTKQDSLILGYCIGFVLVSSKFPLIVKSKFVMIPFYILVSQMLYSFISVYFF